MILAAVMLSGCATMRYPGAYKVEGKEFKEFKDLDDERALKVVALIYNVNHEAWEDGIARSIALEEFQGLLKKRNSKYIKKSGIFAIAYEKVKISAWSDEDLMKLYDSLAPKADRYYENRAPEITEIENAQRITYLTAINSIVKELKKRDIAQKAMAIVSKVLTTALTVALSII